MLQYLIIQLDDTSTSFCHYANTCNTSRLISVENLKKGILFAMKENLMIQFIYPDYKLPQEYKDIIDSIDHNDIISSKCKDEELLNNSDIYVYNGWADFTLEQIHEGRICVLRTSKDELFENKKQLSKILKKVVRLNIVITDLDSFKNDDFMKYKDVLTELSANLETIYLNGQAVQLNLITDRMFLDKMNNCNAGWENITLAPDGKFYICPAFYLADDEEDYGLGKAKFSVGDLQNGLNIKNPQLYQFDYAPICLHCDAYQCKRCVWLNRKTTYEVNTPSYEQCVVAHLERNASRELLANIRKHGEFLQEKENIKEIDYLDPFDKRDEW